MTPNLPTEILEAAKKATKLPWTIYYEVSGDPTSGIDKIFGPGNATANKYDHDLEYSTLCANYAPRLIRELKQAHDEIQQLKAQLAEQRHGI